MAYPARYFSVDKTDLSLTTIFTIKMGRAFLKMLHTKNNTNAIRMSYYTQGSEFRHTLKYQLFKTDHTRETYKEMLCVPEEKPPINIIFARAYYKLRLRTGDTVLILILDF